MEEIEHVGDFRVLLFVVGERGQHVVERDEQGRPFESIYELAQVAQADGDDPSILYGNDTNLNHVQDGSESQGAGQYTPGIYNYVTVFSREPNIIASSGSSRVNITTGSYAVSSGSSSSSNITIAGQTGTASSRNRGIARAATSALTQLC